MPIALTPVVSISGTKLSAAWLDALIEIKVDHRMQVPARCTLRLSDPGYALAEDGTAAIGGDLEVKDPNDSSLVLFKGEITGLAVEQRLGENPDFMVIAHDKSHRLGNTHKVKGNQQVLATDMVSTIASSASLSGGTVDATSETFAWWLQADTDLGLLTELARRNGRDWWVAEGKLNFSKPDLSGSSVTLKLSDSLLSFSVKASAMYPTEVDVNGWDPKQKQSIAGTATSPSSGVKATSTLAGDAYDGGATLGSGKLTFADLGPTDQGEADSVSGSLADRAASGAVTAHGVCDGNGNIKLGAVVEIQDSGPLSGKYPVTSVEHTYRPKAGFQTRFWSGDRWPTTLVDTLGAASHPRASSRHDGLVVATVSSVKDPNSTGMVQLHYPTVDGSLVSDWGRVAVPGAGSSWGNVVMPETGSEVLVGFENGDVRRPVVLSGLYNGQDTIPTRSEGDLVDSGTGAINWRMLQSRTKHVLVFDDSTGDNAGITIKTGDGNNTISLMIQGGSKGITIDASTNDINIKGNNITLNAQGKLSLQAQQELDVSAQTAVKVSAQTQFSVSAQSEFSIESSGTGSVQASSLSLQGSGDASLSAPSVSIGPG